MSETKMQIPKFIADLFVEVDAFDSELFQPDVPVSAEDKELVIGTLSPWCRKAYAITRHFNRQARMLCAEREYDSVDEVSKDVEVCELRYKATVVNEAMFATIRSEVGAFITPCIGVREGWKVVSTTTEEDEPIKSLMAILKRFNKG